ncbi:MAG: hypothetical protein ACR2H4_20640 [Pyrinomonadaceae bacterium]
MPSDLAFDNYNYHKLLAASPHPGGNTLFILKVVRADGWQLRLTPTQQALVDITFCSNLTGTRYLPRKSWSESMDRTLP